MWECITDTGQLRLMQQALPQLKQDGGTAINAFMGRCEAFMESFEPKHQQLQHEVERASRALEACESHVGPNGEPPSCDAEEARYAKAQSRLKRFEGLLNEAWALISDFNRDAQETNRKMTRIVDHAVPYLDTILPILENQYLDTTEGSGSATSGDTGHADSPVQSDGSSAESNNVTAEQNPIPQSRYEDAAKDVVEMSGKDPDIERMLIQTKVKQMFYERYGMEELDLATHSGDTASPAQKNFEQMRHELEEALRNHKNG